MKKFFAVMLVVFAMFVIVSCGETKDNYAVVDNPRISCDSIEEVNEKTGTNLFVPGGVSVINTAYIESDDNNIAEILFEYEGNEFALRSEKTKIKSIISKKLNDPNATSEELKEAMNEGIEKCNDLAGMYYIWESSATIDLENGDEAIVAFNEGKEGFMAWLDKENGLLYSISMEKGAKQEILEKMQVLCSEK